MAVTLNMGTISLDCRIHYSILRFWSTAHTLFVCKQNKTKQNKTKQKPSQQSTISNTRITTIWIYLSVIDSGI